MRTTLTLDDDVARRVADLAHRRGLSFKEAVNTLLRRGLGEAGSRARGRSRFRTQTFRSGFRPGVDPEKLNQLVDDLEAAEAVEAGGAR